MGSIEYIGEKHYSKALRRIKELEQQRDKLIEYLKFHESNVETHLLNEKQREYRLERFNLIAEIEGNISRRRNMV